MPETGFISFLPPDQRKELETLFFFNPEQSRFSEEIEQAVSLFGDPIIQENSQGITITLPKFPEAQCLFAQSKVKRHLLAAVIYFRSEPDELEAFTRMIQHLGGLLGGLQRTSS